jgi:hypothetical protein
LRRMLAPGTPHWPLKKARYANLEEYWWSEDHFQMKRLSMSLSS